MTAKHTPGPWTVSFGQRIHAVAPGAPIVAQAWGGAGSAQQLATAEANARLIAAAPDMLAALEAMSAAQLVDRVSASEPDSFEAAIAKVRAAIAKARGE